MSTIMIYDGCDFGKTPFATVDIEAVWAAYAEAADFRRYEDAEEVERESHEAFVKSFVEYDPVDERHIRLVVHAGLPLPA